MHRYILLIILPILTSLLYAAPSQAYRESIEQGDSLFQAGQYKLALPKYQSALRQAWSDNDTTELKQVYDHLCSVCEITNDQVLKFQYLDELRAIAEASDDHLTLSIVNFNIATSMHRQSYEKPAVELLQMAINECLLSSPLEKPLLLLDEYGALCEMQLREHRYEDAATTNKNFGHAIEEYHDDIEEYYSDYRKAWLAFQAATCQHLGQTKEAQQAYRQWKAIGQSSPNDYLICDYLNAAHLDDELLCLTDSLVPSFLSVSDTCSYDLADMLLHRYAALSRRDSLSEPMVTFIRTVQVLGNIRLLEQKSASLDYSIKYHAERVRMQSQMEQAKAEMQHSMLFRRQMIAGVLVLFLLFVAILIYYRLHLSRQNASAYRLRAEFDVLTNIYNRYGGTLHVDEYLSQQQRGIFALIDCDKFKYINDHFGHQLGDRVLQAVASTMSEVFPSPNVVMRLGGDEFALYLPLDAGMFPTVMANRLETLVERVSALDIPGLDNHHPSISVGAVLYAGEAPTSFDRLYHDADNQLYRSKSYGGCRVTM